MSVADFLNAVADLYGANTPTQPASAAPALRALPAIETPPGWTSPTADILHERHREMTATTEQFAANDDANKARLEQAAQIITHGRTQIANIQQHYTTNRSRLLAAGDTPETRLQLAELDRSSMQHAINTVRDTQTQLPTLLTFTPPTQLLDNPPPQGNWVVVWCIPQPSGGFRCTNLFSDGTVAVYPSPTDRTGGW